VLALGLARRLKQPVRWIEDRTENSQATVQGRGQIQDIELAADADGKVTSVRVHLLADMGAYLQLITPGIPLLGAFVYHGAAGRSRSSSAGRRTGRSSAVRWRAATTRASPSSTWDRHRCARRVSSKPCNRARRWKMPPRAADDTEPVTDLNANAEFRRHLARVPVWRALTEAGAS
jgi:carbon-monoxide dehydrogenase large subunit